MPEKEDAMGSPQKLMHARTTSIRLQNIGGGGSTVGWDSARERVRSPLTVRRLHTLADPMPLRSTRVIRPPQIALNLSIIKFGFVLFNRIVGPL